MEKRSTRGEPKSRHSDGVAEEPSQEWERENQGQAAATSEEQEHREAAEERKAISVHVVYHAILAEGESELKRPTSALAFSGLAAGLSMGFSFLTQAFLHASLPPTAWRPLVAKFGYSVGFLIVILGRQQLFTENTLTPVIPFLRHKQASVLWNIVRLWTTVFFANWAGTLVFSWVLARTAVVPESARPAFLEVARAAMGPEFGTTVVRAIFAGWLIALLVWLLPYAETGRVAVILLMTYVIALGSFSHIIAGSVDTFYLVLIGQNTWVEYLRNFMLPTLIGNMLGGIALVAVLNHAQVAAGAGKR